MILVRQIAKLHWFNLHYFTVYLIAIWLWLYTQRFFSCTRREASKFKRKCRTIRYIYSHSCFLSAWSASEPPWCVARLCASRNYNRGRWIWGRRHAQHLAYTVTYCSWQVEPRHKCCMSIAFVNQRLVSLWNHFPPLEQIAYHVTQYRK